MILNLIISVFPIKSLWLSLKSFCLQNRNKLLFSSGFKFLHRPFQIKNITMKLLASFLIYRQGLTVFEKFSYSENWAKIIRVYFYIVNRNQSTAGTHRLGPRTNVFSSVDPSFECIKSPWSVSACYSSEQIDEAIVDESDNIISENDEIVNESFDQTRTFFDLNIRSKHAPASIFDDFGNIKDRSRSFTANQIASEKSFNSTTENDDIENWLENLRIVNGDNVERGAIPWQIGLRLIQRGRISENSICGGSIIRIVFIKYFKWG